jgi:hypothetical protein
MHSQQNVKNTPDNINSYKLVLEQDRYHVNLVSQHGGFMLSTLCVLEF